MKVLRYVGKGAPGDAEADLRARLARVAVRHKASGLVEVDGPVDVASLPSGWVEHVPTMAEISPPKLNLRAMRAALRR